jgi:hypothetical protein
MERSLGSAFFDRPRLTISIPGLNLKRHPRVAAILLRYSRESPYPQSRHPGNSGGGPNSMALPDFVYLLRTRKALGDPSAAGRPSFSGFQR